MNLQLTWVTPKSSAEVRAECARVAKIAHPHLPYDQYSYSLNDPVVESRTHALIAKEENLPVGLTIIEAFRNVAWISWEEISNKYTGPFDENFHWTVSSLWVRDISRKKGIGRTMIVEAALRLTVGVETLSFLAPFTLDATAVLKKMFPEGVYVTFQ